MNQARVFITLFSILFSGIFQLSAQSISGNINSDLNKSALSYANVSIYKDGKKVASIITDKDGSFHVKLDTGTYVCEFDYYGHEKKRTTIRVTGDERSILELKQKPDVKLVEKTVATKGHRAVSHDRYSDSEDMLMSAPEIRRVPTRGGGEPRYSSSDDYKPKSVLPSMPNASAGKLTAGELNDFAKWNLWSDLSEGVLKQHANAWKIQNGTRFSLQVTGSEGLPLADIPVELTEKDGRVLWRSRTDNTGKAELWSGFHSDSNQIDIKKLQLEVKLPEGNKTIKNPKMFHNGINQLRSSTSCIDRQAVDIAFVVDATGSMGDEIDYLKEEMNDIVFKAKGINHQLHMRFANVFYRDHGDEYLTRTQDFTEVLSEAQAFVSLQTAAGGGDYEEAVDDGLEAAIEQLSWSAEARARIVFMVLDAPPHQNDDVRIKMRRLAEKASEKGIRIVPVVASGINKSAEYLLRNMALASNGTYVYLTDHSGIGGSHIEPSTDSIKVERFNDIMIRIIKQYTMLPDCRQELPQEYFSNVQDTLINEQLDTSNTPFNQQQQTQQWSIQWKAFPNPCRGILHVQAEGLREATEVWMSDFSGKLLFKIPITPEMPFAEIDLNAYASGIYLLRYKEGPNWKSNKILLVRSS